MQILPYVVVVANCCIVPLVMLLLGISIGKYGLPVVWNPNWRKEKQAAARKNKPAAEPLFKEVIEG